MKFILLFIPTFCMICSYIYFDYKLSIYRKQQMISSNQYTALRAEYKKLSKSKNNINNTTSLSIKFITPTSKAGITKPDISMYIAPLSNSPIIKNINIRMETNILDSAFVNSEIWFYVALPIDTSINCRGWINKDDFSILYSNSRNVSNSY